MNELALFAGGCGGVLATKWLLGWRTVCYMERKLMMHKPSDRAEYLREWVLEN